ncbi:hypothetical protein HTV80_31260 [Streptomyces sp. Vc74B-19]|uniref:hypothetical protein n=1 Tax=Streptomyces sp. Vc74B-19 TaxID=2741324 RepID=UPI001BFC24AA|nr:hypothetical protein [Streptomyces sp. Vc74B-19]MBT3167535.1 hypothetical protein [Streptomyces sp. Vc74B-19]
MEFIKAAADLDETAARELHATGITGCLEFATAHSPEGFQRDAWTRAREAVNGLTTDLDRYHRLSDLAFEEEAPLATLKITSKEYGPREYFVWGLRSLLADQEVNGHLARHWREDFDSYVDRFHARFGDCENLGYCPCKK